MKTDFRFVKQNQTKYHSHIQNHTRLKRDIDISG